MAHLSFHNVTKIAAQHVVHEDVEWVVLTFNESQQETRVAFFLNDDALGKRLAAAINAAQVAETEEAA